MAEDKCSLVAMRKRKKLTQEKAAQLAGLSVMTISRIERGHGADMATVKKLAPVYGVSVSRLADSLPAIGRGRRAVVASSTANA